MPPELLCASTRSACTSSLSRHSGARGASSGRPTLGERCWRGASTRRLAERQGRGLPSRPWSLLERRPSRAVRWVDSSHTTRPLPPHSCPSTSHPAALHWPRARSSCAVHRLSHSSFCLGAPQLRQGRCPACWQAWCRQSRGRMATTASRWTRLRPLLSALPSTAVSIDSPSLHAAHSALHFISGPAWCSRPEAYGRRRWRFDSSFGPPLWDVATLSQPSS